MKIIFIKVALLGAAFLLGASGCATVDSPGEPAGISALAERQGFWAMDIKSDVFHLAAFSRMATVGGDTVDVYIEGDGAPWITPYQPPRDPTPQKPVALALAAADPAPKIVYLGRPCQYLNEQDLRNCNSAFWTERRFAPEIISAYDDALTQLKTLLGVKRIRLFGFSGGGVIATLLAA
ncbi:MAG: alpha/beta hydrolase, partial [Gallionella sp.]